MDVLKAQNLKQKEQLNALEKVTEMQKVKINVTICNKHLIIICLTDYITSTIANLVGEKHIHLFRYT